MPGSYERLIIIIHKSITTFKDPGVMFWTGLHLDASFYAFLVTCYDLLDVSIQCVICIFRKLHDCWTENIWK